jgi:hypothetical protein
MQKHFGSFWLALSSLGQHVTVAALNAAKREGDVAPKFPFVRIPMFELPANHALRFSDVESITWNPLVTEAERWTWGAFVYSEVDWHEESKRLVQYTSKTDLDQEVEYDTDSMVRSYIWRGERNMDGQIEVSPPGSLFAPVWQTSPPPYSLLYLNYDSLSDEHVFGIQGAITQSRFGLMSAIDKKYASVPNSFATNRAFQDNFHSKYTSTIDQASVSHAHSIFVQPVFSGLDDANSEMVGFLTAVVAWDAFFSELLPTGVSGIVAVLHNSCDQAYTYVLKGNKVRNSLCPITSSPVSLDKALKLVCVCSFCRLIFWELATSMTLNTTVLGRTLVSSLSWTTQRLLCQATVSTLLHCTFRMSSLRPQEAIWR